MRRVILVFIIGLLSTVAYSQDNVIEQKNGINLIVNDILRLDISSFSGDISYSRFITTNLRTTIGISCDYRSDKSESYSKATKEKTYGIGSSLSILYAFGRKNIRPYLGIGASGSLSTETKEETAAAGERTYYSNTYSTSGFIPFGLEYNILERVIIGIGSTLRVPYYCKESKTTIEDGSSLDNNNYGYSISIDKPQVIISLLF